MGSSERSPSSVPSPALTLLVLALGAILGIGIATVLLSRKGGLQADDPDAPLFI